jgi:hypothetical protein
MRFPSPIKHVALLVFALATAAKAVNIPAGTELNVRLTSDVNSNAPSGQRVTAVLTTPVFVNGTPAISAGTQFTGNTADVNPYKPATGQTPEQPAALRLHFTKIQDSKGQSKSISCVLKDVDNARETVDSSGLITGIQQSETFEAQIDRGINKLESRYAQFAQILTGVKGAIIKQVDPSINYTTSHNFRDMLNAGGWTVRTLLLSRLDFSLCIPERDRNWFGSSKKRSAAEPTAWLGVFMPCCSTTMVTPVARLPLCSALLARASPLGWPATNRTAGKVYRRERIQDGGRLWIPSIEAS